MSAGDRRPHRQRQSADPVARYLGQLQARVMEVYWSRESATVRELQTVLRGRKLAYTTVLTLVSRLWSRGLLEREPEGRRFRYRAAKSREQFMAEMSDELIDRLIDDFGKIAIARLGERLRQLNAPAKRRLRRLKEGG